MAAPKNLKIAPKGAQKKPNAGKATGAAKAPAKKATSKKGGKGGGGGGGGGGTSSSKGGAGGRTFA